MAAAAVWAAAAGMVCWLWPPSAAPCMAAWPNTAVAVAAAGACAVTAPPAVCCVAGVGDSAGTFVTDGCADGCMDCAEAVAGALAVVVPAEIVPDVFAAVCGGTLPAGADVIAVSDMVGAASDTGEA